ncbi:hypothetical protein NESM_000139900 [Novymonas esmeraldas]|uniref:F-box domain-containing protein n=1 Tax=Novymonas esmeraldas TaxID=1808958 RepID=A0AAW0F2M2_9TRYP
MKSTLSSNGKVPPLRSTTVLRPPATGPQHNTAGFASIRLETYHDTSDLKAALRELGAAFAVGEREAAAAPTTATAACSGEATHSGVVGEPQRRAADAPPPRSGAVPPARPTIVVVKKSSGGAAAPEPRRSGRATLLQLPPQLVIHCASFCDLRTLGVLCCVSVRMNVLVTRQGGVLWVSAAQRRRITISVPACAREELRNALERRARERHAEEAYYEAEIAKMEERLSARAQDVYAQDVDVERILRAPVGAAPSSAAASAPAPFWLRQQRLSQPTSSTAASTAPPAHPTAASPQQIEMCAKLQAEIEALEEARRTCECRLKLQEELLQQQDMQLRQWQSLLLLPPCDVQEEAGATPEEPSAGGAAASATTTVSAAQLDAFERRVARLILGGSVATSVTPPGASELPAVLRRGVDSLAGVELVLRACGRGESAGAAAQRWSKFQKICPVNEEYANARLCLRMQTPPQSQHRPSAKQMPALLRLSGFVRRVEAMSDAEVLQAWM